MGTQIEQQDHPNGSRATTDDIKHSDSPCQRLGDGDSQDGQTSEYSIPCLPEDIWRHIVHSLMPVDAAARAACVSRAFLSSWRCYPKFILRLRTITKQKGNPFTRIESIPKKHSGIGVKIVMVQLCVEKYEDASFLRIDRWLKFAVKPGIEELILEIPCTSTKKYSLPCSVLSVGVRNSIRSLHLCSCAFRATADIGSFTRLTSLFMDSVRITGDELECLLSNTIALESLQLIHCNEIISLKIPPVLQQLSFLLVRSCDAMQIIENKSPSISRFTLSRVFPKLELGEASLQIMKVLELDFENSIHYARAVLPSMMPNLETLNLRWVHEEAPMLPTKFVNLKHLDIEITSYSRSYDYSSLISFLDASPSLETWWLEVPLADMEHELVCSSDLMELPVRRHNHLKTMEISGFNSTKSLVELAYCIVKSAVSLESLTLDTMDTIRDRGSPCCPDGLGRIGSMYMVEQAPTALVAIRRYIEDKVAPTTKLAVREYCPQCIAATVHNEGKYCPLCKSLGGPCIEHAVFLQPVLR